MGFALRQYCSLSCSSKSATLRHRKTKPASQCTERYFQSIDTLEKAYWLGFLFADGFVTQSLQKVRLCLSVKDDEHLSKFIADVGGDTATKKYYGPYKTSGKQVHYTIQSPLMASDLIALGCGYKKSLTVRLPTLCSDDMDLAFLRGYFDGDGSQNSTALASGSRAMLEDIKNRYLLSTKISKKEKGYNLNLGAKLHRKMCTAYPDGMVRKNATSHYIPHPRVKIYKFTVEPCELETLVWQLPLSKIGTKFGVSGNTVKNRCLDLGIQYPKQGYWQKQNGRPGEI